MKINEAQKLYHNQIQSYQQQKTMLNKQREDVALKLKLVPDNKEELEDQAAILELTYNAVDEKQSEYQKYLEQVNEQFTMFANMESSKQQGEAMEKAGEDMAKIMEVARRIMKGAKVPGSDEKKLMEFSPEMYQAAKNVAAMVERRKKEEYDSLWGDEEETENPDPMEVAGNTEISNSGPEIISVEDTMASVVTE